MAAILKEVVDFYRFFWRTPKEDKEIVFYTEHKDYYSYFEGLIKELLDKHNHTLCYVTSQANDPVLQERESRVKTFYLNRLLPFFMAFVDCKIFVMTLADLNQFHLKRSVNPVHYVYVFHAMASTHMMYRHGALDYYDSILCCGPHHIKEIRKYEELNKLPSKRLVEAGYYRLERIYEAYKKHCHNKPSSVNKKTILIGPSWGIDNVLESCGVKLINILLEADYKVIVRPHPETVKHSPELLALFTSKFNNNPNFTLETSIATDDSLILADILICDCSGIAFEYALGTERPVLFIDVPKKIKNQRFKELGIEPLELSLRTEMGLIVSLDKLNTITQAISELMANSEVYKKRLAELRKQNVYCFGSSSDISARYITELVNGRNQHNHEKGNYSRRNI